MNALDFHEDWNLSGAPEDFEADCQWLIEHCIASLEEEGGRAKKPPSRWGKDRSSIINALQSIDYRMAYQLDKRHQEITGRSESFFKYALLVMSDPIHEGGPLNGEYACLFGIGDICHRWGIAIGAGNEKCFHDFMGLLKKELPFNWDIYKLPERINRIYFPPS